jgi:parallel beta-helix repeat protein
MKKGKAKSEKRVKFGKRKEKALIFAFLFAALAFVSVGCASATTIYVYPGESIQAAVDAAYLGDTILVHSGTYYENVNVTKQLTLQGVDTGSGKPVVDAGSSGSAITLSADGITLEGFKATNSGWGDAGIKVTSNDNTITGNNARNNNKNGIDLSGSSNNILTNNNASKNVFGINLWYYSSNNTLSGNVMSSNSFNLVVEGISLSEYIHSIDTTNTVNGKPVYYLVNQKDKQVPNDAGYVGLVNSTNIAVKNLILKKNGEGILLAYTKGSVIENNTVSDNDDGIYLSSSCDNTITGNNASNNGEGISLMYSSNNILTNNTASANNHGIYLEDSSNNILTSNTVCYNRHYAIRFRYSSTNKIYLNNFISNDDNVYFYDSTNIWNSSEEITYIYNGSTHINYLGNYWSDYKEKYPDAEEINGYGIWDTPYSIDGDKDNYPLVRPWGNYFVLTELKVHNLNTGENFSTIQAAIDDPDTKKGHTITVDLGTYNENVNVYKSITIRYENGSANCIVRATNSNDHVFKVTADYVNISGFTVKNATGYGKGGICLRSGIDHCNISDNTALNNYIGIKLYESSNNIIAGNIASDNKRLGILLKNSSNNNTVTGNIASNNNIHGILLLKNSNNNTITGNTAGNNGWCGIGLNISSNNNTITGNTASNNEWSGIGLKNSSNNTITGNTASNNGRCGIGLNISSENNIITGNTANSNNAHGIYLNSSSNNLIYNNYFNNTNNAYDEGNNIWNITKTLGTNIIDGPYLGGNYWSDYIGEDTDGDGLDDILLPYNSSGNIQNGGDWLPLVKPAPSAVFDAEKGTYPSIMGTHEGKIKLSCNLNVSKLYTYPCAGTGGHTESIELYENGELIANGTWSGYVGDWLNITIHNLTGGTPYVTLLENHEYNYTIITGSYPQIHHNTSLLTTNGWINCTSFVDANGKVYDDWIPAIKLE